MIDEGDIPAIPYKMSLREPKSVKKVDGLRPVFVDFYVPTLTPRDSSNETSLQLSEAITLFEVLTLPAWGPCCIASGRVQQKTPPPTVFLLLLRVVA
jgi:hypothetical protein